MQPQPSLLHGLLAELSLRVGSKCAQREVKWLKQALQNRPHAHGPVHNPHVQDADITPLVKRRIAGEPIQYILGRSFYPRLLGTMDSTCVCMYACVCV